MARQGKGDNDMEQDPETCQALARPTIPPSYYGMYSNSGFDMLSILSRVATRPNPTIDLGPIDLSSSFIVVDAKQYDLPIVYASQTFETLTGYTSREIIGKNCRFLQSPDGKVEKGARRKHVDNGVVYQLKRSVDKLMECQYININYKKGGEPFVNLITIVPVSLDDSNTVSYLVGFQVDLMQQSRAILRRLADNSYVIDFNSGAPGLGRSLPSPRLIAASPSSDYHSDQSTSPPSKGGTSTPSGWITSPPFLPDDTCSSPAALAMINDSFAGFETSSEELSTVAPVDPGLDLDIDMFDAAAAAPSVADALDIEAISEYNLIQNSPDFIHILSSRGIILFASPQSSKEMLEYESGELIGRNISKFCHPGDLISLMRELKCAGMGDSVSIMYRFRRKFSGHVWLDVTGHKYEMKNRKRTKCFILSGRQRRVGELKQRVLARSVAGSWGSGGASGASGASGAASAGGPDTDFWAKISPEGLFLYVSPTSYPIFGSTAGDLYGRSLLDFIYDGDRSRVINKLREELFSHVSRAERGNNADAEPLRCSIESDDRFIPASIAVYSSGGSPGAFLFIRVSINNAAAGVENDLDGKWADEDIFALLGLEQTTSLQFELNQLKMSNKRLMEELDSIAKGTKKNINGT
ncbi:blue light receptor [Borealophlyctis nickersoniae]|nr:blue light receptor [Borealophlyctis nickersoniae]